MIHAAQKKIVPVALSLLVAAAFVSVSVAGPGKTASDLVAVTARTQYSYVYWLNGFRRATGDTSADVLCFETGQYGFKLNVDDLSNPRFGLLDDNADYEQALAAGTQRLDGLPPAELAVELALDGKTYRAETCRAGAENQLQDARLWESGQIAQHYDLLDLRFKDDAGNALDCSGKLDIVAWPGSLTFTAELAPKIAFPIWDNAELRVHFKTAKNDWHAEKRIEHEWKMGERQKLSLNCNLDDSYAADSKVSVQMSTADGQTFPVRFDAAMNCKVAKVSRLKRSFAGGYVKITDYDEFDVVLESSEETAMVVPFFIDFRSPANITGMVPILCHADGSPTGVHLQISKNWHHPALRSYMRAYALIPVTSGQNHYRLRIAYGFYGSLPSASHAQLCLIGYGGNQRWDQLALGCGGECITFDADMSLTELAVCDVRVPLGRHGKRGNPWNWTDAGWGGDWLGIYGADNNKITFAGMKVAYLAQGPCLSDVIYKGAYGSDRSVLVDARIQLPRTDDYGRTYQKLNYKFERNLDATNTYFTKRHAKAFDRVVAYGNANGLIAEKRVTGNLKKGDLLIPPTELTGPGPWWVAFPERKSPPTGYVSLIIRDYKSSFGGKTWHNPFLSVSVQKIMGSQAMLETLLVPPPEVKSYTPGDRVSLDSEWVHLVTEADNYGGPNEAYRKHLSENPRSWKTTYREVVGNTLSIDVEGGKLLQRLPIVIQAMQRKVTVTIQGGVGYVPIRFEGLKTAAGYAIYEVVNGEEQKLDQSVHGNDFWQTDYDAASSTYKMSFNLPVDGKSSSEWVLKR